MRAGAGPTGANGGGEQPGRRSAFQEFAGHPAIAAGGGAADGGAGGARALTDGLSPEQQQALAQAAQALRAGQNLALAGSSTPANSEQGLAINAGGHHGRARPQDGRYRGRGDNTELAVVNLMDRAFTSRYSLPKNHILDYLKALLLLLDLPLNADHVGIHFSLAVISGTRRSVISGHRLLLQEASRLAGEWPIGQWPNACRKQCGSRSGSHRLPSSCSRRDLLEIHRRRLPSPISRTLWGADQALVELYLDHLRNRR